MSMGRINSAYIYIALSAFSIYGISPTKASEVGLYKCTASSLNSIKSGKYKDNSLSLNQVYEYSEFTVDTEKGIVRLKGKMFEYDVPRKGGNGYDTVLDYGTAHRLIIRYFDSPVGFIHIYNNFDITAGTCVKLE